MKSIIQEASSVAKAVESAWVKAGKPQQFSIKVFQESEKNFLGMTSKPAKIAFIFNDVQETATSQPKKHADQPRQRASEEPSRVRRVHEKEKTLITRELPSIPKAPVAPKEAPDSTNSSAFWTAEQSAFVHKWLRDILQSLGYENIEFSLETQKQLLKIQFSTPLLEDATKQKHLFRNIAFLMLQSLRREFKRPLRNARVVLLSE